MRNNDCPMFCSFLLNANKLLFYKDTFAPCRLESKMAEFKTAPWLRRPFTERITQPISAVWTECLVLVRLEPGVQRQVTTKNGLQIDLGNPTTVTKVATQGRQDSNQWPTSYSISYSLTGSYWVQYTERGKIKVITLYSIHWPQKKLGHLKHL